MQGGQVVHTRSLLAVLDTTGKSFIVTGLGNYNTDLATSGLWVPYLNLGFNILKHHSLLWIDGSDAGFRFSCLTTGKDLDIDRCWNHIHSASLLISTVVHCCSPNLCDRISLLVVRLQPMPERYTIYWRQQSARVCDEVTARAVEVCVWLNGCVEDKESASSQLLIFFLLRFCGFFFFFAFAVATRIDWNDKYCYIYNPNGKCVHKSKSEDLKCLLLSKLRMVNDQCSSL